MLATGKSTGQGPHQTPLIAVRNLTKRFSIRRGASSRVIGTRLAVDGVDFDIPRGTTLALVGESGCGKTTVARTIIRLISPTRGSVKHDGIDVHATSGARLRRLRRSMQMVFQDPYGSLNPRITVGRTVTEPLWIRGEVSSRTSADRAAELLDFVGLEPGYIDRYPHELSGGQRQRVGIARAIATEPDFIICDEPVSALDVSVQSQVLNLLTDLKRRRELTYLFITHNLAVVRHVSDIVAVMYQGRIVETGSTSAICETPRHPYTEALLAAVLQPWSDRRTFRTAGPGNVVGNSVSPAGCPFHPRCQSATDECRQLSPPLQTISNEAPPHTVVCYHPTLDHAQDSDRPVTCDGAAAT